MDKEVSIATKPDLEKVHILLKAQDSRVSGISFDGKGVLIVHGGSALSDITILNAVSASPPTTKPNLHESLKSAIDTAINEPGLSPKLKAVLIALRNLQ